MRSRQNKLKANSSGGAQVLSKPQTRCDNGGILMTATTMRLEVNAQVGEMCLPEIDGERMRQLINPRDL